MEQPKINVRPADATDCALALQQDRAAFEQAARLMFPDQEKTLSQAVEARLVEAEAELAWYRAREAQLIEWLEGRVEELDVQSVGKTDKLSYNDGLVQVVPQTTMPRMPPCTCHSCEVLPELHARIAELCERLGASQQEMPCDVWTLERLIAERLPRRPRAGVTAAELGLEYLAKIEEQVETNRLKVLFQAALLLVELEQSAPKSP